jgi:hypothetical protein
LQDDGKEMTRKEIIQYLEPMKGKKSKKKYKNIAHGGYFYPELYSLASKVLALLETKQLEYFSHILASQKNMSNTMHIIGNVITNCQFACTRGDVHSIGIDGGLMDLIDSSKHADSQQFCIYHSRNCWSCYLRYMELRERQRKQPQMTRSKLLVLFSVNCKSTFLTCWGLPGEAKSELSWM